jgi:hypothetical protein
MQLCKQAWRRRAPLGRTPATVTSAEAAEKLRIERSPSMPEPAPRSNPQNRDSLRFYTTTVRLPFGSILGDA